jgi:hypothetical protein
VLLRHYGISPGAVDPGTVFITSRPGLQGTPNLLMQHGNFQADNAVFKSVPDPRIQTFGALPTLLAAAVGWVFAGRQPSAIARQPLE